MTRKPRVLFLIHSLAGDGAERQVTQVMREMDRDQFDLHIAVLHDPGYRNRGEIWPEVAAIPGVTLHSLPKRQGLLGYLIALPRLINLVLRIEPDILHGYLQGNVTVLLVGGLLHKPVAWGIRRTSIDTSKMDLKSRILLKIEVWLSRFADLIIFNSQAGFRNYRSMGMHARRMQVIPNGYDVSLFTPEPGRGLLQRKAWGVPEAVPLIGIAGQLFPVKDHATFLRMAVRVLRDHPSAWFVYVGDGDPAYRESLQVMARSLGIADRVLWPGVCLDMTSAYNALSLLVLSSSNEGCPNVLAEAMACGVPCVASPAGDAPTILGNTGLLCAFGDDQALASAVLDLLREAPEIHSARRAACRARISTRFSDQVLARNTEQALLGLLSRDPLPVQPVRVPSMSPLLDGPRYLLRFDDICPTMDWSTWNTVEEILVAQGVKPILAVVPDNQDPTLMVDPPASDFWDRVRGWQARGWAIGLHGYQHLRVNSEPGILGFPSKSEFAGLPYEEQLHKLKLGMEIFAREGVRADVWIAPSHSFDLVTVAALRELGIRTISDGMAFAPYEDNQGTVWIPQQYAIMRPMPWGVWTFCYHLGFLSRRELDIFKKRLEQLGPRMISLGEARALGGRRLSPLDRIVGLSRKVLTFTRRQRTRWAS